MKDLDARIAAALRARADTVREDGLPPAVIPGAHHHPAWVTPLLAAAAVLAIAVGVTVAVTVGGGSHHHPAAGAPTSSATKAAPSPSGSGATETNPTPAPSASSGTPTVSPGPCFFADLGCRMSSYYEPLWPFASYAQARQWETQGRPNGSAPWHADPGATALFFTQNVLGFGDITLVTSTEIDNDTQAVIGVGYPNPNGVPQTAALLHLVRYGTTSGQTAPWEVVGSEDTDFSIETPAYGSSVSSPMTVGGHITGVDENITVAVIDAAGKRESRQPVPAGGDHAPWSVTMPFGQRGVLIVVASTGGHLQQHERFAIQGVHTSR